VLLPAGLSPSKQAPGQKSGTPKEMAAKLKKSALQLLRQDALEFLEDSGAGFLLKGTLQSEVGSALFPHAPGRAVQDDRLSDMLVHRNTYSSESSI